MNNDMLSNNLYVSWLQNNRAMFQLNAQNPALNTYIDLLLSERYSFEIDLMQKLGATKEEIDKAINDLNKSGFTFIPDMTSKIYNEHGRLKDIRTGELTERVGIYATMDDSLNMDLAKNIYTSISSEMKLAKLSSTFTR